MAQLEQNMELFNAEMQGKVARTIGEYHRRWIGTPMQPTIEERLWLAERCNPIWWLAAGFLWLRDQYHLFRATRFADKQEEVEKKPDCSHQVSELATSWEEAYVPCPECGIHLAMKPDGG